MWSWPCGRATSCPTDEAIGRVYLTEATVKTHVAYIDRKLGLRGRAQAVVYAHKANLAGTPADNEHGDTFEPRVELMVQSTGMRSNTAVQPTL